MKSNKNIQQLIGCLAILVSVLSTTISCAQTRPVTHDPVVPNKGDIYYLFFTRPVITIFTSLALNTREQSETVFAN